AERAVGAPDVFGGEAVLEDLVLVAAHAGLVAGEPREMLRVGRGRAGHGVADAVGVLLGGEGPRGVRPARGLEEAAGLLDGGEIPVEVVEGHDGPARRSR